MSKLPCNVAAYRPDPDMLAANFSSWQLETLLEQAALLLDRCLADFREYSMLDRAWRELHHDLEILEQEVELDRRRAEQEEPEAEAPLQAELKEAARERAGEGEGQGEGEAAPEAETPPAEAEAEEAAITSMLGLRSESVRRRKELAAPGGPLALNEQRDLVLRRLCRDYEEAVNRVSAAEEGLKRVYGYAEPSPLTSWSETLGVSITSFTIWTRNVREWLARYQQNEQTFTRVISLRALMNRNAWGQLRHARDSFSVKLQVPLELFQGYENCRFRGVSASLVGEAGTVPWSALIRLPEAALYQRSGQRVEVDQSDLPPCLLGRVENRRSVRCSEICGMITHLNASPIGRATNEGLWSLELFKPVGATTELFAQVDDLVVEMKISGVAQRMER